MTRVCLIGAGSSGLPAGRVLRDAGIEFDWFELGSDVGGNWRYDNDNGRSAAYRSLHIDTSRARMQYRAFPMPDDWPMFLHHTQVQEYFERFADHFGLRDLITFRTSVERCEPTPDGGWEVSTHGIDTGTTGISRYTHVVVATGHHWSPNMPRWPGSFAGEIMHSHSYRTPESLAGHDVVIVGFGNSAADIAVDAAGVANSVTVSTRRSAHVIPRFALGRPTDQWARPSTVRLPLPLQRLLLRTVVRLTVGDQEKAGIPRPVTNILSTHPTLSQDLVALAHKGMVEFRPDVSRWQGSGVRFVDGSETAADVVILATGYRIEFPFLSPAILDTSANRVDLYRRVVHPDHPGLLFLGLVQPLGAIMPIAELQAEWVRRLIQGAPLPARHEMAREIAAFGADRRRRYVDAPRHTIQVDHLPYLWDLTAAIAETGDPLD